MKLKLVDPYRGVTPVLRTTINVPERTIAFLKSLCCQGGVTQYTINILLSKLETELEKIKSQFPEYDSATYINAVGRCSIVLGPTTDAAGPTPAAEAVASDDRHGTTSVAQQTTQAPVVPGDSNSKSKKGRARHEKAA